MPEQEVEDRREHWTREQFEDYYYRGDVSGWLKMGYFPIECRHPQCMNEPGPTGCHGWKMTSDRLIEGDKLTGRLPWDSTDDEIAAARAHRDELLDHHNIDPKDVYR